VFVTIYICTVNLLLLIDNTTGMTHLKMQNYFFVTCIFIMLIFFYQQMHFYLTYKILKYTLKHFFTVTPKCFGPYGPKHVGVTIKSVLM